MWRLCAIFGAVCGQDGLHSLPMDESGSYFAQFMTQSENYTRAEAEPARDWLPDALKKYPRGELTDLIRFAYDSGPAVHGGDVYGFFLRNQKRYQKAVVQRKRWYRGYENMNKKNQYERLFK